MRPSVPAALAALLLALTLAAPAAAVTNGSPDGTRHPYVGIIIFDDPGAPDAHECAGSLLSSTVILTAGHCGDAAVAARAWFSPTVVGSPDFPDGGASAFTGTAYSMPVSEGDVGVVVLDSPVPSTLVSRYAVLPPAGIVDTLPNKTDLDYVGYGATDEVNAPGVTPIDRWTGDGTRMLASGELVAANFPADGDLMKVTFNPGTNGGGFCFHDSGAPMLLGGTDTVLATQTFVINANCTGIGYGTRIDLAARLAWVRTFLAP